jgi:hypothetical protein
MKCLKCGKELTGKQQSFCSALCKKRFSSLKNYYKNVKPNLVKVQNIITICKYCGKKFVASTLRHKYCNSICSKKGNSELLSHTNNKMNYQTIEEIEKIKEQIRIKEEKQRIKKEELKKKHDTQNYLSLQRLANVYNNSSTNELKFKKSWIPKNNEFAYYIDGELKIIYTNVIKPGVIYFKTIEIAKECCNFFYRTHYNINRSNKSCIRNKKGDMVLI